ncbi:MAG: polyprenyl synthetase family protein [Promethearchaeota archaeon]
MGIAFKTMLGKYSQRVNNALNGLIRKEVDIGERLTPIHGEYYKDIGEYLGRGGKRLRPAAFIAGYEGVGGKERGDIDLASLSIELLHNATLLHDDLIDHDETRRGGPTFHAKYRERYRKKVDKAEDFGMAAAILGGNSTYNLGLEILLRSGFKPDSTVQAISLYQRAFREVIEGVLFESFLALKGESNEAEYLDVIRLKTSALFEKGLLIGATLGGGTNSQKKAISQYAILTGQAFQIQDDILGTFGTEKVTGKPADSDVREGKQTILIIKAFEFASESEKEKIGKPLGDQNASHNEINVVRKIIEKVGALEYARKLSIRLAEDGQKSLDLAEPKLTQEANMFLKQLSDFVVKRSY